MRAMIFGLFAAALAQPALAASPVAIDNSVFVERVATTADGQRKVTLEEPKVVIPGDNLVFVLNYRNTGAAAANQFVITNPLPAAIQYRAEASDAAEVSVDGGKNWGRLAAMTVRGTDGSARPATDADVTHLRWAFSQPVPAGASGKILFRGKVK